VYELKLTKAGGSISVQKSQFVTILSAATTVMTFSTAVIGIALTCRWYVMKRIPPVVRRRRLHEYRGSCAFGSPRLEVCQHRLHLSYLTQCRLMNT
jgi:hypothetical protein